MTHFPFQTSPIKPSIAMSEVNFQKLEPLVPRVTALELQVHHWNAGPSGPPGYGAPMVPGTGYGFEAARRIAPKCW